MVLGLFFLDGTVVVDEDEGVCVLRVGVALGARVARAKVALFVSDGGSVRPVILRLISAEGEDGPVGHSPAGYWLAHPPAAL